MNKYKKINILGLLKLYFNYIKKNAIIFTFNFFIPYIFLVGIFRNNSLKVAESLLSQLILASLIITFYQSTTVILSLNLEWKLSTTYKRIGLTYIKTWQFIFINAIVAVIIALASNLIFLIILGITMTNKFIGEWGQTNLWILPINFLSTWILSSGFACFVLFISVFITTKLSQGLLTTIITIIPFGLLVTMTFIMPNNGDKIFETTLITTLGFLGFGFFFGLIFTPLTIYFFSWSN